MALSAEAQRGDGVTKPDTARSESAGRAKLKVSALEGPVGEGIVAMPVWFDEHTVARRWGVSVYTVQRERKRGRLES